MKQIRISEARKNLKNVLDEACANQHAVKITRPNAEPVVLISLSQFELLTKVSSLLKPETRKGRKTANEGAANQAAVAVC